jgi:hypothetical protein
MGKELSTVEQTAKTFGLKQITEIPHVNIL